MKRTAIGATAWFLLVVFSGSGPSWAGDIFVTVGWTHDQADLDGGQGVCATDLYALFSCTLRAAVQTANANPGPDTIHVPAGHYRLTLAGPGEDYAATGDLDISDPVTIEGAGVEETIIDAQGIPAFELWDYLLPDSLWGTVRNATVTGAWDTAFVLNGGGLVLESSRVRENGIAIYAEDPLGLEIVDSHIDHSTTRGTGAIHVNGILRDGVKVELTRSTVSNNRCTADADSFDPVLCGSGVTIEYCEGRRVAEITNSTISSNAGYGVSFENCSGSIRWSTVTANSGVGFHFADALAPFWSLEYTIVASNGVADCQVVIPSRILALVSLDSDGTCGLDPVSQQHSTAADPMLHPLGGVEPSPPYFAPTHHPLWGSPVVDVGTGVSFLPATDQEGAPRLADGDRSTTAEYDIGAIEVLPCLGSVDVVVGPVVYAADAVVAACRSISTVGNVEVENGNSVTFAARDFIAIGDGFKVDVGAEFSASIERWAGVLP